MFPIRDHNPSERRPFVTYALIAINVLIFISYYPALSANQAALFGFYDMWALIPAEVSRGVDGYTLVSSMFLHGGWLHLAGNMLFLWIFGDNVEDLLGHGGFLLFYLVAGIAAAALQMVSDPGSQIPVVGASGAIAGVMGGYLLMFPRARIDVLVIIVFLIRIFTVPAWLMLGLWFGLQLVNGLVMPVAGGGGVAYWAHAGGFVVGLLFLLPAWIRRGGPAYWNETHGLPPHDQIAYQVTRRSSVPRISTSRIPEGGELPPNSISRIPRVGRRGSGPETPWGGRRS